MQFAVELPIVAANVSPQLALDRMRESGRSGVIYFRAGAPVLVHAADVMKGIALGKPSLARVTACNVERPLRETLSTRRQWIARKLVRPKYTLLTIDESRTVARIDARTEVRMQSLIEPPLDCYCNGPRRHGYKHADHGSICGPDRQPIECFRK